MGHSIIVLRSDIRSSQLQRSREVGVAPDLVVAARAQP